MNEMPLWSRNLKPRTDWLRVEVDTVDTVSRARAARPRRRIAWSSSLEQTRILLPDLLADVNRAVLGQAA
jgi:hypothetical protein